MHPSTAYLRLSEGPDDLLGSQVSLTRRLLALFVAFILFTGTSLFAMAAFDVDQALIGKATAASGKGHGGDDDHDNSGPGSGGDGDDDSDSDTRTDSTNTRSGKNTDTRTDSHSDGSRAAGTDSSHGKQDTDSSSDDRRDGTTDSSKRKHSDDSNSDDDRDGTTDTSKGDSKSARSHATSDSRGDRTKG
jgi:hypothetical protein